ncbi:GNAT family N-acetyltransferase [Bermanella sp. 47_1433_sub80_T6]|nr:GNAT family N-acetyltransferase [Bermanella sp. 47_1433_sub80_T6]
MSINLVNVDYLNSQHAQDLIYLLDSYAQDPMGGGETLNQDVKDNLAKELAKLPHALSLICYVDNKPAGLVNCFEAFSSFMCKPILNIHDVVVLNEFRGQGISQLLLEKVEHMARDRGCGKITLEVLEGNKVAQNSYMKFGFAGYELDPTMGKAMFWQKSLV